MSDPVKRFVPLTEDDIETIQHALNCAHSTGDVDSREASEISNRLESAPEITGQMIERGAEAFYDVSREPDEPVASFPDTAERLELFRAAVRNHASHDPEDFACEMALMSLESSILMEDESERETYYQVFNEEMERGQKEATE